ncbi:MAG: VOC family protein [Thomasclavelia ramosa]
MRLGTTYISVNDFAKSLAFISFYWSKNHYIVMIYRWATFDCGNSLSLYNRQFDIDFLVNNDYRGHYNHSYLTTLKNENSDKINTSVIFNFEVEDLISEYERIKN